MTAVQASFMDLQQQSIFRSPKRKRGDSDPEPRLVTSGFPWNSDLADSEGQSPSSKVTGKFQRLDIESPYEGRLLFPKTAVEGSGSTEQRDVSLKDVTTTSDTAFKPPESSAFTFKTDLDLSTSSLTSRAFETPLSSGIVSDQFWQASEISGWSPGDPDEDNYGVNGVGYRKTPAVAHAISQKRKQQIADYRSRETKEARQKRGERRLNASTSKSPQPTSPSTSKTKSPAKKPTRLVRFDDG